jgi:hypothetical protein
MHGTHRIKTPETRFEKTTRAISRDGRGLNEKNVMAMAKNGRHLGGFTGGTWQRMSFEMRVPRCCCPQRKLRQKRF